MADDVTFQPTVATPPTGTKVATDDVGGSHFQKVKLDLGADGASDPVVGTVPVSGTVALSGTSTVEGEVSIVDGTGDSAMDDANDALRVNVVAGGGGGTQYDEGDTDASITGTAILWEDAGDTLSPVSVAKPLPVTIDGTVASAEVKITDGTDDAEVTTEGNLQTITPNRTASGTLNLDEETLEISLESMASFAGYVPASDLAGTIQFEWTMDGNDWYALSVYDVNEGTVISSIVNPSGPDYFAAVGLVGAYTAARVRISAYTSGSIDLVLNASTAPTSGYLDLPGNPMLIVGTDGSSAAVVESSGALRVIPEVGSAVTVSGTVTAAAQPGVDIGDVTVNNAAGAAAVNIQDGGNAITVDGTVAVTGVSTAANQTTEIGHLATIAGDTTAIETAVQIIDDWDESDRAKVNPIAGQAGVQGASGTVTALTQRVVLATDVALPAGNNNIGDVDVLSIAAGDNNIGNVDIVTMPNVTLNEPVTVDGAVTANPTLPGTAVLSNVNDTAASTTLLSANAARLGATIHNDSTAILYVKFGTTASTTSYTVKMVADAYYEVPFGYTGRIDGIWASDASGAARMTELSA